MTYFAIMPSFARSYNKTCQNNLVYIKHSVDQTLCTEWEDVLCCLPDFISPSILLDDKSLYNTIIGGNFNLMMSLDLPYAFKDGKSVLCLLAKSNLQNASVTLKTMRKIYQWIESKISILAISDLTEMYPDIINEICLDDTSETLGRNKVGLRKQLDDLQKEIKYIKSRGKDNVYRTFRSLFGDNFSEAQFDDILGGIENDIPATRKENITEYYTDDIKKFIQKTPYYKDIRIHLVKETDWPHYEISLNSKDGASHRPRKFKYAIVFEHVDSYKKIRKCCPLIFHSSDHLFYTVFLQAVICRAYSNCITTDYKKLCVSKKYNYETAKPDKNAQKLPNGQWINSDWKFTENIEESWRFYRVVDKILFSHGEGYEYDDSILKSKLVPSQGTIYPYIYNTINKHVHEVIKSLDVMTRKPNNDIDLTDYIDPIHFLFAINDRKQLCIEAKNIILDLSIEDRMELEKCIRKG